MYYRISVKRNVQFYISIVLSVFYAMILEFGFQLDIMSCIQFNIMTAATVLLLDNRNHSFFALYNILF